MWHYGAASDTEVNHGGLCARACVCGLVLEDDECSHGHSSSGLHSGQFHNSLSCLNAPVSQVLHYANDVFCMKLTRIDLLWWRGPESGPYKTRLKYL